MARIAWNLDSRLAARSRRRLTCINRRGERWRMIFRMRMVGMRELSRPVAAQVSCTACELGRLCRAEAAAGDEAFVHRRRLCAGETLFTAGTPQSSLYAVHAGFLKTARPLA